MSSAEQKTQARKRMSDIAFILWAGGAALLSYSLVYALRKPYTAAAFGGYEVLGMDYKIVVTIAQIIGYTISKFIGIKLISELKRENRLKFILLSVVIAEVSLILFGALSAPYNIAAMFINGLSLGCMWGVIFSFLEGRRVTDLLASLMGVSMIISSGAAKSVALFVVNTLNVNEFWMPALIGAVALPLLLGLGVILHKLPPPDPSDVASKSQRVPLNGKQRWKLYRNFMPFLTLLFAANILLVILRDVKEDFLVNIIDVSQYSSWLFARIDAAVTVIILLLFSAMVMVKNNKTALSVLFVLIIGSMVGLSALSFGFHQLNLSTEVWLFCQSMCIYMAYLTFQTIFFDRFIACFQIKGNVGFFIVLNDFLGYAGTVLLLLVKELVSPDIDWLVFYNRLAGCVGVTCCVAFLLSYAYFYARVRKERMPALAPLSVPV